MVTDFFKHKTLLKEIVLSDSVWKDYTFHLPHMTGKDVFLLFNINRTWNPQKALGVPDPRHLGIAIGDIRFRDNTP